MLSKATWLSWLKRLCSKQKMVSSKLAATLFLAAIGYLAAKNKTAVSFELTISFFLDRHSNQLSHTALLIGIKNLHCSNKSASQQRDRQILKELCA